MIIIPPAEIIKAFYVFYPSLPTKLRNELLNKREVGERIEQFLADIYRNNPLALTAYLIKCASAIRDFQETKLKSPATGLSGGNYINYNISKLDPKNTNYDISKMYTKNLFDATGQALPKESLQPELEEISRVCGAIEELRDWDCQEIEDLVNLVLAIELTEVERKLLVNALKFAINNLSLIQVKIKRQDDLFFTHLSAILASRRIRLFLNL